MRTAKALIFAVSLAASTRAATIVGCDPNCTAGSLIFSNFSVQVLSGRDPGFIPVFAWTSGDHQATVGFQVFLRNQGPSWDLFRISYDVLAHDTSILSAMPSDQLEADWWGTACVNHEYSGHYAGGTMLNCANFPSKDVYVNLHEAQYIHVADTISVEGGRNGEYAAIYGWSDNFHTAPEPTTIAYLIAGFAVMAGRIRWYRQDPIARNQ